MTSLALRSRELAEQALGYTAFAVLFSRPMDELAFQLARDPQINDIWEARIDADLHARLVSALEDLSPFDEASRASLEGEFNRAFVGPGPLVAPLWESVYRTEDRLIFQESTLQVRRAYAEEGFVMQKKGAEPDDNLSAECEFVAALLNRASEAAENDDAVKADRLVAKADTFVREHLTSWLDDFADALTHDGATSHYAALAAALACYAR